MKKQQSKDNHIKLYKDIINPELGRDLDSVNLLKSFEGGKREYLYYSKNGKQIKCLDFLTNFGPDLFGINNEYLINVAKNFFDGGNVNLCNGSLPTSAVRLADKLNRMTGRITGKDYVIKFANSGTEGVEVAFKVAEVYKYNQTEMFIEKSRSNISRAKREIEAGSTFSEDFIAKVSSIVNTQRFAETIEKQNIDISACTSDEILNLIHAVNEYVFSDMEPVTIALEKGFHGKTHGSLRATYRKKFRKPYQKYLAKTIFVKPNNTDAMEDVFAKQTDIYYKIKFQDGELHLTEKKCSKVTSIILEPVMGEGGALVLNKVFLQCCRNLADKHDIPLILDEIQCGLGRTGYFLSTQWSGVKGSIYILSKQLGGGIAKISATIIDAKYYDKYNDILNHTSTFNEDSFSSLVALEVLEMYERDNIEERVQKKGTYLKKCLEELKKEFPQVIEDVTGMGLLLAVRIADQSNSYSVFIRSFWETEALGGIIAAHIFNVLGIRLFVTLSNRKPVIRLQPCAYIKEEQCDQVVEALRHVCYVLSRDNAYELLKFIVGHTEPAELEAIEDFSSLRSSPVNVEEYIRKRGKAAFMLVHFLDYSHAKEFSDYSLRKFTSDELTMVLEKFYGTSDDVFIGKHEVRKIKSETGEELLLVPVFTMVGPGKMKEALTLAEKGSKRELRHLLRITESAKEEVINLGGTSLGYGGYWSIIAQYGMGYQDERIFVPRFEDEHRVKQTTGNTFTAYVTVMAVKDAIKKVRASGRKVILGAIGINGNICNIAAMSLLKDVDQIIAVGRSPKSTERSAANICNYLMKMIIQDGRMEGAAKTLSETEPVRELLEKEDFRKDFQKALADNDLISLGHKGRHVFDIIRDETEGPVIISDDPKQSVRKANVIFTATNDPEVFIFKEDFPAEQGEDIYIIDTSTPHNVDKSVNELPHVHRRGGGLVTTVSKQPLIFRGTDINEEDLYACIAETLLTTIDKNVRGSAGPISLEDIEAMAHAGEAFGFILSDNEGQGLEAL